MIWKRDRRLILDLFRFHPAEAAAMLDKGNANGMLVLIRTRSEGAIESFTSDDETAQ